MLDKLIRVMDKHYEHFTILKFSTGWKVVIGTPHLENSEDYNSDYQRLFRINSAQSIEEAFLDCIERGYEEEYIFNTFHRLKK